MGEQGALFDVPEREAREARIVQAKWGGRASTNARAKCRLMLPWVCRRCGDMIRPEDPESSWHAGHREDRAAGGTEDGIEPEHARCNTSAGGKVGAAITNAQRAQQPTHITRERTPQWW
jgi:hypothetical protein